MSDDDKLEPRLLNRKQAAAYCGVSVPTFDKWWRSGFMPDPMGAPYRWDKKAIDAALDKRSGLTPESSSAESALERWKREQNEKKAAPLRTSTGEVFKSKWR